MKVRFKVNTKWGKSFVRAGSEVDVTEKVGADLIKRGVAEDASAPAKAAPAKAKPESLDIEILGANKPAKEAKK